MTQIKSINLWDFQGFHLAFLGNIDLNNHTIITNLIKHSIKTKHIDNNNNKYEEEHIYVNFCNAFLQEIIAKQIELDYQVS